jgi:hypothetical protein
MRKPKPQPTARAKLQAKIKATRKQHKLTGEQGLHRRKAGRQRSSVKVGFNRKQQIKRPPTRGGKK